MLTGTDTGKIRGVKLCLPVPILLPPRNTQDKDIIRLVIGYHQLEGKRISLKKPFAILEKARVLRWPIRRLLVPAVTFLSSADSGSPVIVNQCCQCAL